MKYRKMSEKEYEVVLVKGEEIVSGLVEFAKGRGLDSGVFYGLGAAEQVTLAYYDLVKKEYVKREFEGRYEIANISGNVARHNGELVVHAHVTLGDKGYKAFAGHLVDGTVTGTLEVWFSEMGTVERKHDRATGLNLMEL